MTEDFESLEESNYSGNPAECYRFQQGESLWLYTSADRQVAITPGVFEPEVISRGAPTQSQEDESGSLEIRLPRTSPVAALFLTSVPATPLSLTIYRVHRSFLYQPKTLWQGQIVSVRFDGAEAILFGSPSTKALKRAIPTLLYQTQCNHPIYSLGCGISAAAWEDLITVTTVTGADVISNDFLGRASGWYNNGVLIEPGGDRRWIVEHVGNRVTLISPFPSLPSLAVCRALAGCERTEAVCKAKFSNLVNFFGFERIPGRNPHEGRVD